MRRDQLAHILRAAARITEDNDILVIGSQSILGSFDEASFPSRQAWALMKARLVDAEVLLERAAQLETVPAVRRLVSDWLGA